MDMSRRIGSATFISVLVMFGAAGCGSQPSDGVGADSVPSPVVNSPLPTPTITNASQMSLPLVSMGLTVEESARVHDASDVLMRRCVARFGIVSTYPHIPEDKGSVYDVSTRYGLVDLSVAQKSGYGLYYPATNEPNPSKASNWHPSAKEYQVTYGQNEDGTPLASSPLNLEGKPVPARGCARYPGVSVIEGTKFDPQFIGTLMSKAYAQAEAEPRISAVERAWSRCMTKRGYAFQNRIAAIEHFDFSKPPTRDQIETATADVECKYETNYLGIWMSVETSFEDEEIAAHQPEITEYQRVIELMRTNSQRILDEG